MKDNNPRWGVYENSFEYQFTNSTVYEQICSELSKQKLTVECYATHALRKDSLIGKGQIDLLLIFAGPPSIQIPLLVIQQF